MVDNGQITTEEAKVHPNKNIITRALGVSSEVNADLNIVSLEQDDILLLCTDGLSNYVSEEKIVTELTNFSDKSIDRLIELANEGGGVDNITAIAVKI
jgi:protein phosphatase